MNKTPHLYLQWRAAKDTVDGLVILNEGKWGILEEPGHGKFAVYRNCHDKGKDKLVWVPLAGRFDTREEAIAAINTHLVEHGA